MSSDELIGFVVSILLGFSVWGVWYASVLMVRSFASGTAARRLLLATPPLSLAILYVVLRTLASSDVRDSASYLGMYMCFGAAWIGIGTAGVRYFGIDRREDALERRNVAAAVALSGALLGVMLCFAGANVGDGPGWWIVLFCAALSTAALYVLWFLHEKATNVAESITVDRDLSSGFRLAGFLVAAGLILGRAVAGDWESTESTLRDFVFVAWPVLLVFVGATLVDRAYRPTASQPARDPVLAGLAPAVLYIAAAAGYVFLWLDRP